MNGSVTSPSLYHRAPGREMGCVKMATGDSTCYRGGKSSEWAPRTTYPFTCNSQSVLRESDNVSSWKVEGRTPTWPGDKISPYGLETTSGTLISKSPSFCDIYSGPLRTRCQGQRRGSPASSPAGPAVRPLGI